MENRERDLLTEMEANIKDLRERIEELEHRPENLVKEIRRLDVGKDQTLLVTVPDDLTDQDKDSVGKFLSERFPGVRVVVAPESVPFSVVSSPAETPEEAARFRRRVIDVVTEELSNGSTFRLTVKDAVGRQGRDGSQEY